MTLLTNPVMLRVAAVLVAAGFAFLMGLGLMRRLRRSLAEEATFGADHPSQESLPVHMYHSVIQQLKQQKHELLSLQQVERRREKIKENISAAVLSNLSCGVIFFASNRLVRQANGSARQILGLASLAGMSPNEIFREAKLTAPSNGSQASLAEAVTASLRENASCQQMAGRYLTPAGDERFLDLTVSSINAPDGEVLGAACLINDKTEMAKIRRQQALRGEMSAEMALELRNSLTTISGYAQQLAASRDPELARQLAADVAAEAAHLDRTIGGFLAGARARAAAET